MPASWIAWPVGVPLGVPFRTSLVMGVVGGVLRSTAGGFARALGDFPASSPHGIPAPTVLAMRRAMRSTASLAVGGSCVRTPSQRRRSSTMLARLRAMRAMKCVPVCRMARPWHLGSPVWRKMVPSPWLTSRTGWKGVSAMMAPRSLVVVL